MIIKFQNDQFEPYEYEVFRLMSDLSREPWLDLWHTSLIYNCRRQIKRQGAWAYTDLENAGYEKQKSI